LFPAARAVPDHARGFGVQVRLDAMELHRPRQWGACWIARHLYEQLQLDRFFAPLLPSSREGTSWQHVQQTLAWTAAIRGFVPVGRSDRANLYDESLPPGLILSTGQHDGGEHAGQER
jgi:hypothetical protein